MHTIRPSDIRRWISISFVTWSVSSGTRIAQFVRVSSQIPYCHNAILVTLGKKGNELVTCDALGVSNRVAEGKGATAQV